MRLLLTIVCCNLHDSELLGVFQQKLLIHDFSVLGMMDLASCDLIRLFLDCSDVLMAKLLSDHCLHKSIVVSQDTEFARSYIELIDELTTLLRNLRVD